MDLLKGLHGEFAWFIWGVIALGVIWFFTGGTESETAREGAYLEAPAPLDSGRAYGNYYEGPNVDDPDTLNLPRTPGNLLRKAFSPNAFYIAPERSTKNPETKEAEIISLGTSKTLVFKDLGKARESDPNDEYLRVAATAESRSNQPVSGLILRGTGLSTSIFIPHAVNLPILGTTPAKSVVSLPPGGEAVITTGRSPIGMSFRVNKCMGYLEQFQDFVPDLEKSCPLPANELRSFGPAEDAACLSFVQDIPRCTIYQGAPPKTLSSSCVAFLAEKLNYNACVANHKNDKDFYTNEWRLYLNQSKELWKNRDEIIRLMDRDGKALDALTY